MALASVPHVSVRIIYVLGGSSMCTVVADFPFRCLGGPLRRWGLALPRLGRLEPQGLARRLGGTPDSADA